MVSGAVLDVESATLEAEMVEALIGIGCAMFLQLLAFAYGYGKLSQKVDDACHRLKCVEDALNRRLQGLSGGEK